MANFKTSKCFSKLFKVTFKTFGEIRDEKSFMILTPNILFLWHEKSTPRANVINPFTTAIYKCSQKAGVCAPGKPFQQCPMFVDKP